MFKAACWIVLYAGAFCTLSCGGGGSSSDSSENDSEKSIARIWDEANLDAIRIDTPRPPVHARNLWHLSAAMYDAWAVYDVSAHGYALREKITAASDSVPELRREAISYAAYQVLKNRYAFSANAETTLAALDTLMQELGFDPANTTVEGDSPAAIGNRSAAAIISLGDTDGSNQSANYADPSYTAKNAPLVVQFPGNTMSDPNAWQPLALKVAFTQNGIPLPSGLQTFIGAQWNNVKPFALERTDPNRPYIDLGPPPRLGESTDLQFKSDFLDVLDKSSALTTASGVTLDISPGAYGNNPLGTNAGSGHAVNPVTGESYSSQVVKLGDFSRVLAEFWADGPSSETPPGHWNTIANTISDSSFQSFRFQGEGDPLDRLEWDVKLYFALNGALHDAAVNCWGTKRVYDSVRPISAVRYMATQGQSSDPSLPSFDPQGLPLVAGLTDLVTQETWPAGRHAGIQCCQDQTGRSAPCIDSSGTPGVQVSCVGEVAVFAWAGPDPAQPARTTGVQWIRAKEWTPYQLATFVTPAFPGYNSGHSTFSRAAAEVLTAFTGSEFFPGGLGEFRAPKDSFLKFETGPSEEVRLQWGTYFDAADQAGQSRIFGGIHIRSDDFTGRIAGSAIGVNAFQKAKGYFNGTA